MFSHGLCRAKVPWQCVGHVAMMVLGATADVVKARDLAASLATKTLSVTPV